MKRYFFKIAYDGSNYSGWQRQKNVPSVQQAIEEKLELVLQRTVRIHGCGRTDAGVHASQYYFHVDLEDDFHIILWKLNYMVGKDIAIHSYFEVQPKANAQKDAVSRTYEYLISLKKNPFQSHNSIVEYENLDVRSLSEAVESMVGIHDFKNFCKRPEILSSTVCQIFEARLEYEEVNELIKVTVKGNRFLHHMMRLLVGNILKVGKDRLSLGEFKKYLSGEKMPLYFELAPAQGLTLKGIEYDYIT